MPQDLLVYPDPSLPLDPALAPNDPFAPLNDPLITLNEGVGKEDRQGCAAASTPAPVAGAACLYLNNAADDTQASHSILRTPQASDSSFSAPQASHSVLNPTGLRSLISHSQAVRATEAHVPKQQDYFGVSAADHPGTSPHDSDKAVPTECQSVMCSIQYLTVRLRKQASHTELKQQLQMSRMPALKRSMGPSQSCCTQTAALKEWVAHARPQKQTGGCIRSARAAGGLIKAAMSVMIQLGTVAVFLWNPPPFLRTQLAATLGTSKASFTCSQRFWFGCKHIGHS